MFGTCPILGRFQLWLEDVDVEWLRGKPGKEFSCWLAFVDGHIERLLGMTTAVIALGTRLFGRFGAGATLDKGPQRS